MSLPVPITISQEAELIRERLETWVRQFGGVASVVSNLKELWNQSSINSQVPRVLIVYNGETSRGSFSQIAPWHRVDRAWTVAVTKGRGFFSIRGAGLYDSLVAEMPLYDAVENVRDQVRFMDNISEETPMVDYRGIKPMSYGNMVIDGYTIDFTTANDIPSNLTNET